MVKLKNVRIVQAKIHLKGGGMRHYIVPFNSNKYIRQNCQRNKYKEQLSDHGKCSVIKNFIMPGLL
jgi:predicted nucleic-acid-binding Zn-ribbon protein